ncbi:LOB domain-containing protein 38-like [Forsythia ovata]|uniref:LOB domain-containing protein 38-like n=1 Tax=Forsythia ovata TaxID=205694 RepID=A0ABD1RM83_9LAMI
MSCNGCRVLRRGCSEQCILRPCLEWIESPQAQANVTLFVSKFFGRSDLMAFISAVPESKRPALFQSLLFEACGRTVNPVNGVVGLLSTGNWHICQAAVETVLTGGTLLPMPIGILPHNFDEASEAIGTGNKNQISKPNCFMHGPSSIIIREAPLSELMIGPGAGRTRPLMEKTASFGSGISELSPGFRRDEDEIKGVGRKEPKLLNLFA